MLEACTGTESRHVDYPDCCDCGCINFNKPDQRELKTLTEQETRDYIAEGQFAKGSMLPKVEACLDFVKTLPGRIAVITSLKQAEHACEEGVGTKICSDRSIG